VHHGLHDVVQNLPQISVGQNCAENLEVHLEEHVEMHKVCGHMWEWGVDWEGVQVGEPKTHFFAPTEPAKRKSLFDLLAIGHWCLQWQG